MERLTRKNWRNLDPWEMCGQDNYCKRGCHEQGGCTKGCIVPRIYARLAAYEDLMERWKLRSIEEADRIFQRVNAIGGTDLMAQYRDIGSIDHLRDLLHAERGGRLVVLPCKVGDTVYQIDAERVYESEVKWIIFDCDDIAFDERAIGVSIFLTSEEAEAALAQKGGTHEADSV